ncbi:hypothetical protein JOE31_001372 [Arthrobacter sp. PvP023]|uniref:hypothetical protein n=1 Tax=Micrococcaceae TaxID=1268 RepID=UPI001AE772C3|nr:hypothetical protein [Arthrobacter sp. PvP023]MBP1135140.1 hypothetical protein [Arthrobacter sp. PvP023]
MSKVAGRKKRIIITTAAMLAIGGGAAFAYWSATGTGDTTTGAGSTENFTITSSIEGEPLSPGGPTQKVTFVVTNPGSGVQKLSAVAVTVAGDKGTPWTSVEGCSAADFTVGKPTFTQTEIEPGKSVTGTVTLQMKNLADTNQDGCKGATVPLHFAAS